MKVSLEKHVDHEFKTGDLFKLPNGFVGIVIECVNHMTPYMIVNANNGTTVSRSTSIGLCFDQIVTTMSSVEFIGRLNIISDEEDYVDDIPF